MTTAAASEAAESLRQKARGLGDEGLARAPDDEDLPPQDHYDTRLGSFGRPNTRAGPPSTDAEGPSRTVLTART